MIIYRVMSGYVAKAVATCTLYNALILLLIIVAESRRCIGDARSILIREMP